MKHIRKGAPQPLRGCPLPSRSYLQAQFLPFGAEPDLPQTLQDIGWRLRRRARFARTRLRQVWRKRLFCFKGRFLRNRPLKIHHFDDFRQF